jgi:hypothetical protein
MSSKNTPRTRLRVKILAAVLGCLVALIAAEGVLRVATAVLKPRFTKVDPTIGWYHYPSSSGRKAMEGHEYEISYNSHGYRYPEHDLERTCGVRRVLVLGDSFVDGSEVGDTETFTWLLNQSFPDIEFVNLGVYGFSTAQESILLDTTGRQFAPDLVLVVTMQNDFWNNVVNFTFFGPSPRFMLHRDSLVFEPTDHPNAVDAYRRTNLPGPRFIHEHSYLYYLLNHYMYQVVIRDRIQQLRRDQVDAVSEEDKRRIYLLLMDRIAEDAREMGADLKVVFGYTRGEVRNEDFSNDVIDAVQAKGIGTIDMLDPFRDELPQASTPLYYEHDVHWTVAGHEVVADILAPEIRAWWDGLSDERRTEIEARGCES